jgi:hypothetical protein
MHLTQGAAIGSMVAQWTITRGLFKSSRPGSRPTLCHIRNVDTEILPATASERGTRDSLLRGGACHLVPVFGMQLSDVGDGWHRVPGYAEAPLRLVSGDVVCDRPEERCQRLGLAAGSHRQAGLGMRSTASAAATR